LLILESRRISDRAKLVYCLLAAWVFEGSVARIGQRRIAKRLGFSQPSASRCLKELNEAGFIVPIREGNGKRNWYRLTDPIFRQKQGKETVLRSARSGVPRMVSVAKEDVA
jgi:DNA-binding IclR family transcriptional regulator